MNTAYRMVLLVVTALAVSGCNERDSKNDGEVINNILLPTDVVLNLFCPDDSCEIFQSTDLP